MRFLHIITFFRKFGKPKSDKKSLKTHLNTADYVKDYILSVGVCKGKIKKILKTENYFRDKHCASLCLILIKETSIFSGEKIYTDNRQKIKAT